MTTKTAKHTPGPWVAKERHANYQGWVVLRETGSGLRRVDGDKDGTFSSSDARLIAAAPEMLSWVQDMLSLCENRDLFPQACEQARTLLARIDGGNNA